MLHLKGTGRVPFYDPRNEKFLLSSTVQPAVLPNRVSMWRRLARGLGIRDPRNWRQWMFYDQGMTSACTGYGSATLVAADPVRPTMPWLRSLNPMQWYLDNVEQDRKEGRHYSEGATTLAAMKVGKRYGYWNEYRWSYDIDEILFVVHNTCPVIVGTNWYESMWDRDSGGVCRIRPGSANAGGHLYCINGYDPRRGLLRSPSTWNDGYYKIPVEDMRRLIHESGECAIVPELVPPLAIAA